MVKKYRLIAVFAAVLFLLSFLSACNGGGEYVIPEYKDDKSIDIIAFYAPPHMPNPNYKFTQDAWDKLAEAGYNIVIPLWLDANFYKEETTAILDKAHNAGIKVIITDLAISDFTKDMDNEPSDVNIEYYKDHPAFCGLMVDDETDIIHFPRLKSKLEYGRELFPDKIIYTNTCQKTDNWETYCAEFIEATDPRLFSYDKYCLLVDGPTVNDFISAMAIARLTAKNYNIPAWNFALVSGHYNHYRDCSVEDIRWQMACYMAFGYETILHYSYHPDDDTYEKVIDKFDKPTDLYYRIQKANSEVRKWDHVYKSFTWQCTATLLGSYINPEFLLYMPMSYVADIEELSIIKDIASTEDILIGEFLDGKNNYGYMITSAISPFYERETVVNLKFDNKYKGVIIFDKDITGGEPHLVDLVEDSLEITLEPGEGRFLIPVVKR